MIYYNPIDGDIYSKKIKFKPLTCFLMTQLGSPIPREIVNMRRTLKKYMKINNFEVIDATSKVTGRDFLLKIYHLILSVPLGIALISDVFKSSTIANIFFEIGLLQALGKEVLIIKNENFKIPSDFVRTEYIEYNKSFKDNINDYVTTYFQQAEHYELLGSELNTNPIISIDYLKRAYLMTGDEKIKTKIIEIRNRLFDQKYLTKEIQVNIKNFLFS